MTTKTTESGTKTREGRSTREAILEAASRLIHVHGYNHTSLDDVLRESNVGKGNFYYHFKSKEELGYAILDQIIGSSSNERSSPASRTLRGERSRRSAASSIVSSRCNASATVSAAAPWAISRWSCPTSTRDSVDGSPRCSRHGESGSRWRCARRRARARWAASAGRRPSPTFWSPLSTVRFCSRS